MNMNLAFLAAVAVFVPMGADIIAPGKPAPNVTGKLTTGATFNLQTATKTKPVLLYFISTSCPVTADATKYYDRLAKAYAKDGVPVVGIVNDGKDGYANWQKVHKVSFGSILDPEYNVIQAYGVFASPSAVLVAPGGKVQRVWVGWGQKEIREASEAIAKHLRKTPPRIDLTGAPAAGAVG
jgi:peroxiredoxin